MLVLHSCARRAGHLEVAAATLHCAHSAADHLAHRAGQDEALVSDCGVRCLVHHAERGALIAGCADGVIRMHYPDGDGPPDGALPTTLNGTPARVWGPHAVRWLSRAALQLCCGPVSTCCTAAVLQNG